MDPWKALQNLSLLQQRFVESAPCLRPSSDWACPESGTYCQGNREELEDQAGPVGGFSLHIHYIEVWGRSCHAVQHALVPTFRTGGSSFGLRLVRCAIVFAVLKMNCQGAQTKPEHAESFVVSLSFWFPRLRFPSHAGVPPGVSRLKPGLKELWRAGEMCKGCGDAVAHM